MDKQTNRNRLTIRWFHPDVPKAVRDQLMGPHSKIHRYCAGMVISSLGLVVVWVGHISGMPWIEWPLHHIGYGIHGLGYLPIFNSFETKGGGHD